MRIQRMGSFVRTGPRGNTGSAVYYSTLSLMAYLYPGDQHRKQRKMLNPAFSIAHIRQLSKDIHHSLRKSSCSFIWQFLYFMR